MPWPEPRKKKEVARRPKDVGRSQAVVQTAWSQGVCSIRRGTQPVLPKQGSTLCRRAFRSLRFRLPGGDSPVGMITKSSFSKGSVPGAGKWAAAGVHRGAEKPTMPRQNQAHRRGSAIAGLDSRPSSEPPLAGARATVAQPCGKSGIGLPGKKEKRFSSCQMTRACGFIAGALKQGWRRPDPLPGSANPFAGMLFFAGDTVFLVQVRRIRV